LRGFLIALGTLAVKGVGINLTALFAGRDVQALDLSKLLELTQKPQLSATTWLINGGGARHMSEAVAIPGKLPPLSLETATEAKHNSPAPILEKEDKEILPRQGTKIVVENTPSISEKAQESLPSQNFVHQPTTPLPMSTETGAFQPVSYTQTPQDAALIAYQEYQQTMRQFLSLQEQVMMQFLGSSQQTVPPQAVARQITPTQPMNNNGHRIVTPPPMPQPGSNGKHNGNGVAHTSQPVPTVQVAVTAPVATVKPVSTPTVVKPVEVNQVPALPDKMQLTETLLQLVSDRTGYPIDMLGLDQDLEAELGIDSIKRVEIMGALQKTLPQALAATVQSKMESLTRVKSLNGIVQQLQEASSLESPTTQAVCRALCDAGKTRSLGNYRGIASQG
jgi:acyl carrier protein